VAEEQEQQAMHFQFLRQTDPVKLVAMADVNRGQTRSKLQWFNPNKHKEQIQVPADQKFIGFDGYEKAMDTLDPGDVVIFTPHVHFAGCISIRHQKRIKCIYGKAGHSRRVFFPKNA